MFRTHPGSRIQGSKRHRIPDPDPQHRLLSMYCRAYFRFFSLFAYSGDAVPLLSPTQDGRCGGSTQGWSLYWIRRITRVVSSVFTFCFKNFKFLYSSCPQRSTVPVGMYRYWTVLYLCFTIYPYLTCVDKTRFFKQFILYLMANISYDKLFFF